MFERRPHLSTALEGVWGGERSLLSETAQFTEGQELRKATGFTPSPKSVNSVGYAAWSF